MEWLRASLIGNVFVLRALGDAVDTAASPAVMASALLNRGPPTT
jgi:hypothetical protein